MKTLFTFLAIVLTSNLLAQNITLYEIPEIQEAIKNETRTENGEPGSKYWQNSSDYTLEVFIDTSANILKGQGTIVYHNNSPDVLKDFHIRLYQDLYKVGSARNHPLLAEDIHFGTYIDSLLINDKPYIRLNKPINQSNLNRLNTNLYIQLSDSIVPGASCVIKIVWNFPIPTSAWPRRLGRYSDDYFISQWYPQVAVYDDILGWDDIPHYGLQEFYNDFNNYDVTIQVPKGYMVWATGDCDNLMYVLDEYLINTLNKAKNSDTQVAILTPKNSNIVIKGNTWHYKAEQVTDFAFAIAKNYIWYGTSVIVDKKTGRRVFVDIVYPEESTLPSNSLQVARDAIKWTSESFPGIPFPFSHATSFFHELANGICMEFPMIANDMIFPNVGKHNAIVAHELFHNYMPFYVGLNETIFGWMDEGWVNYMEYKFKGDGYSVFAEEDHYTYPNIAGSIYDRPLFSSTMDESISNLRILSYIKPAINLMLLEELIGEEAFSEATKDFINTWKDKHPTPYDFFNVFNKHAKNDINWFLKPCYFEYGYADLGIKSVKEKEIIIEKKGSIPISIRLEITYNDNSTESVYENLMVWKSGISEYKIHLENDKTIRKVVLGDDLTPDRDISNNIYEK
jgi:hypothetical protein